MNSPPALLEPSPTVVVVEPERTERPTFARWGSDLQGPRSGPPLTAGVRSFQIQQAPTEARSGLWRWLRARGSRNRR